jgi:tRNA uridine 5-carbamoylmethylation protein Kti12
MKTAYLTSGPRGAGKSTFVAQLQKENPALLVFDRDKFFDQEFGNAWMDHYLFSDVVRMEIMEQEIKRIINSNGEDINLIVDYWNGLYGTRIDISRMLRGFGINVVNCLYFVTPFSTCFRWFRNKPDGFRYSTMAITHNYKIYHAQADDLRNPNKLNRVFDKIYQINPLQLRLPGVRLL